VAGGEDLQRIAGKAPREKDYSCRRQVFRTVFCLFLTPKMYPMPLVSIRNYGKQYIVFPLFLIMFTLVLIVMVPLAFEDRYMNLQMILFSSIFAIIAISGLVGMLRFDRIEIDGTQLSVYSIAGKKKQELYLPSVTSWAETINESKGNITKTFTLYSEASQYTFKSVYYKNYEELKAAIMPYGVRDSVLEARIKAKGQRRFGTIMLTLGLCLIIGSGWLYIAKSKTVLPAQTGIVGDLLGNTPEIQTGSKGAKSIRIRLQHYPDFVFRISGDIYRATDAAAYVSDLHMGDSIFITLDKGAYERKFLHRYPMTFEDKYWDYSHIQAYGIATRSRSYLSLDDYNKNANSLVGPLIAGIMGLIWMALGGTMIRNANKLVAISNVV